MKSSAKKRFSLKTQHDIAMLEDLKLQPSWLPVVYISLGLSAGIAGFISQEKSLLTDFCLFAGGGLLALGIEKYVTRSIRQTSLEIYRQHIKNTEEK